MAIFSTTGSDTYPAGHQVGQSTIGSENTQHINFTTTSYVDSGLEIEHTTVLSSANLYLIFDYYHGMVQGTAGNAAGMFDVCMTTSSATSYVQAESINNTPYPQYMYIHTGDGIEFYLPVSFRIFVGLETGMTMPATKSSWAAGNGLRFRIFGKRGTGTFRMHENSSYHISVTEITR